MAKVTGAEAGPKAKPAWRSAAVRDWRAYFDRVEGDPPRDTALLALDRFDAESLADASKTAIDLGCGSGRDTAEMLRRGWAVEAIDGTPEAFARLVHAPGIGPSERLTMRLVDFERLTALRPARLVNASFSLPFCPPEHFERVWGLVRTVVEPGGRFAGQLFGDRHSWATIADRSHQTRAEADAMLEGWTLERFDEAEKDGDDAEGNAVHWHVFHVVARRPAGAHGRPG